jgi:N-methylhydantoinase B
LFNGALERATNRPWGVFGGDAGAVGRFVLGSSTGQRALVAKPSGVVVSPDEWLIIDSPGAGGYGPAAERSVEAIERDRISGKFSDTFIQNHYAHAKAGKH